jgi:hypothetical protein
MQWKNEITAHTDGISVLIWHGSTRISDVKALRKYDVVRAVWLYILISGLGITTGRYYLRHPGKLLPKTAAGLQTSRKINQREIALA